MKKLKRLRTEAGISQQKLAEILGCSQQSIHKYENLLAQPDIETMLRIARYFETTVDYLVGNTEEPEPDIKRTPYVLDAREAEYFRKIKQLPDKQRRAIEALIDHLLP